MSQVTCDCGRELSFAGVVVQQCPDCGRWVSAGASPGSLPASQVSHSQDAPPAEVPVEVVADPDRPLGGGDLRELARTVRIGRAIDRGGAVFLLLAAVLLVGSAGVAAFFLLVGVWPPPGVLVPTLFAAFLGAILGGAYRQTAARARNTLSPTVLLLLGIAVGVSAYIALGSNLPPRTANLGAVVAGLALLALAATAQWLCYEIGDYVRRPAWTKALERFAISSASREAEFEWRLDTGRGSDKAPALGPEQVGQLRDACRAWNHIRHGAALFLAVGVICWLDLVFLWVVIAPASSAVPMDPGIGRGTVLLLSTALHLAIVLVHGVAYALTKKARFWVPVVMATGYGGLLLMSVLVGLGAMLAPGIDLIAAMGALGGVLLVLSAALFVSVRAALACLAFPSVPEWCREAIARFERVSFEPGPRRAQSAPDCQRLRV